MGSEAQLAWVGQGNRSFGLWSGLVRTYLHAQQQIYMSSGYDVDTLANTHTNAVCVVSSSWARSPTSSTKLDALSLVTEPSLKTATIKILDCAIQQITSASCHSNIIQSLCFNCSRKYRDNFSSFFDIETMTYTRVSLSTYDLWPISDRVIKPINDLWPTYSGVVEPVDDLWPLLNWHTAVQSDVHVPLTNMCNLSWQPDTSIPTS